MQYGSNARRKNTRDYTPRSREAAGRFSSLKLVKPKERREEGWGGWRGGFCMGPGIKEVRKADGQRGFNRFPPWEN